MANITRPREGQECTALPRLTQWEEKYDTPVPVPVGDSPQDRLAVLRMSIKSWIVPEYFTGQEGRTFLPRSTLRKIVRQDVISSVIDPGDIDLVQKACRNPVIFVTWLSGSKYLNTKFLKTTLERLQDGELPLHDCPRWISDIEEDYRQDYRQDLRDVFILHQQQFVVPVFKKQGRHSIKAHCSIPISILTTDKPLGEGAFNRVDKVYVHPDHNKIDKTTNVFALKKFESRAIQMSYLREINLHKRLPPSNNKHIVRPLASLDWQDKYYIFFPCGNGDLEKYMREVKPEGCSHRRYFCWFLQQIYGLSEALEVLHKATIPTTNDQSLGPPTSLIAGFHHDIKPENIIWFPTNKTWRVSDFGCGKIAEIIIKSGGQHISHQTLNKMGNVDYGAPEGWGDDRGCSRPYDIWSMGCLFLELLVWLLGGYGTLKSFRSARNGYVAGLGSTIDERFYELPPGDGGIDLRQAVKERIKEMKADPFFQGELRVLLDVVVEMMKIDAKDRPTAEKVREKLKCLENISETELEFTGSFPVRVSTEKSRESLTAKGEACSGITVSIRQADGSD
ncbi:hypothetical protein DL771_004449 [Monosporascus sp. 5C6A]|nr:hypothetical protein DL771_004449 [Monosporascus sp. 5C6A]